MNQEKLGEKSQKMRNKRFMTIIVITVLVMALLVFGIFLSQIVFTDTKNSLDILMQKRFVEVSSVDLSSNSDKASFDLLEEEYFDSNFVIKDKKVYDSTQNFTALYNFKLQDKLTSTILTIPPSRDQIVKSNYIIERNVKDLLDKKLLKMKFPPLIESDYKKLGLTKVRIHYSKDFLPIKLEGLYINEEQRNWKTLRTYSYPFKNKSDFDKKLNEQIQILNEIESEKETE